MAMVKINKIGKAACCYALPDNIKNAEVVDVGGLMYVVDRKSGIIARMEAVCTKVDTNSFRAYADKLNEPFGGLEP